MDSIGERFEDEKSEKSIDKNLKIELFKKKKKGKTVKRYISKKKK